MRNAIRCGGVGLLLVMLASHVGACGEGGEGDATMKPGKACLACHDGEEHAFGFAGTVYASADGKTPAVGATITVIAAGGTEVSATANQVGNFYSERSLSGPFQASIEADGVVKLMGSEAPTGNCNDCHSAGGGAGRLVIP